MTPQARQLGLPEWWLDNWGANPEDVTLVLAEDEWGLAAAWVKRYGGPSGSGFVRLYAGEGTPGRPSSVIAIQTAAELWPLEGAPLGVNNAPTPAKLIQPRSLGQPAPP